MRREMRTLMRKGKIRWMTQSVRDGEMSYPQFAWELRYPTAALASVVALVMLFVLMSSSYVSLWLALTIVLLAWIGAFAATVASTITWYNGLLDDGQEPYVCDDWDDDDYVYDDEEDDYDYSPM